MFTYLAVRQNVLNLAAVVASVPQTQLDLSALIPAGAHSAIFVTEVTQTVAGTVGNCQLTLEQDAASGASFENSKLRSPTVPTTNYEEGIMGIAANRSILYTVTYVADAQYDINVYLLGYVE